MSNRSLLLSEGFRESLLYSPMATQVTPGKARKASALARKTPQAIGALRWVFIAYQLVVVFISWTFFAGIVMILSAVTAICIGWASWLWTGAPPESAAPRC
jgi:hypothetical protein